MRNVMLTLVSSLVVATAQAQSTPSFEMRSVTQADSIAYPIQAQESCRDASGNFFIGGLNYDVGTLRVIVAKFSPSGQPLWTKTWDSEVEQGYAFEMTCDPNGNLYVATTFDVDPSPDYYLYPTVVLKFDRSGNLSADWQDTTGFGQGVRMFAGDWGLDFGLNPPNAMIADATGVYVAGTATYYWTGQDFSVFKIDQNGDFPWFGEAYRNDGQATGGQHASALKLSAGSLYAAGEAFVGNWGRSAAMLVKLDPDTGEEHWIQQKTYANLGFMGVMGLDADANGNITMMGLDPNSDPINGDALFAAKYTPSGDNVSNLYADVFGTRRPIVDTMRLDSSGKPLVAAGLTAAGGGGPVFPTLGRLDAQHRFLNMPESTAYNSTSRDPLELADSFLVPHDMPEFGKPYAFVVDKQLNSAVSVNSRIAGSANWRICSVRAFADSNDVIWIAAQIYPDYNGTLPSRLAMIKLQRAMPVQLTPDGTPALASGTSKRVTIRLQSSAPAGGTRVNLSSTNSALRVPASVTIAAGQSQTTFNVTAGTVTSQQIGTIRATVGQTVATLDMVAMPFEIEALTLSPASVAGGQMSSVRIRLNFAAPAAGVTVRLASSNTNAATLPTTVTIRNSREITVQIRTKRVTSNQTVQITGRIGSTTLRSASLEVRR